MMGPIKKLKLWWKSTTPIEKWYIVLGSISIAASVASVAANVHSHTALSKMKVEVNLYPEGKDDPNPIRLEPAEQQLVD